ncbi:MAG: Nif3-like dinuclear metal center hexameric protein, partial [Gemmataceae bacterium]|nr:Nif3-like dinuclear metal center hexameric protein [Gemmataceae bacterium]
VSRVLTCLTLTPAVAREAVAGQYQMIVTHHPILFRGVKRLTTDTPDGRIVAALAGAGIAVYSPHTAFDDCPGGINDQLAQHAGLTDVRPLRRVREETCKIVVFVPEADRERVLDAMFQAGAGVIGEYRECSFRLAGTGTFFGSDAANPAVGQKLRREEVAESRVEVVCPRHCVDTVIAAMRSAHSYEEPAYDVYTLLSRESATGSGRIGTLPNPITLDALAGRLCAALRCPTLAVHGDAGRAVSRVAVACGAAGEYLSDAVKSQADVFVSGEMRFHEVLAAEAAEVALILTGHYASERFALEWLARWLCEQIPGLHAAASEADADPLRLVSTGSVDV